MMDGVTISTAAITAIVGGGGIGWWVRALADRRKCERCEDHPRLDGDVRQTREDIAEIRADLRNICRSLDLLREEVRRIGERVR